MNAYLPIENGWTWLCFTFGATLFLALIMQKLGADLVTSKVSAPRTFSILDLEFPSHKGEIAKIIRGIYKLPSEDTQNKVLRALRRILYVDYLFMPAIYGSIFLLCMGVAGKLSDQSVGQRFFAVLAWLQLLPLLFDILENLLLLSQIKKEPQDLPKRLYRVFVTMVSAKWIISVFGAVTASMMVFYFFLKGNYTQPSSLIFVAVVVAEVAVFFAIRPLVGEWRRRKRKPEGKSM